MWKKSIYNLVRPSVTEAQAQYCATVLAAMPKEDALALIARIQKERDEVAA